MAEKTLKTRIVQKHDTEANWLLATNFTPMNGEIIIYDEDDNYDYKRVKIGDGKTLVSNLPFIDKKLTDDIAEIEDLANGAVTVAGESLSQAKEYTNQQLENYTTKDYVTNLYTKLNTNTVLGFYCIEDVTIVINGISKVYPANSNVEIKFIEDDEFEIIPTSNNSILALNAFPGALGTYYPWLEGVKQFSNILFDMNDVEMYSKWSQGNQGSYQVQFAQYTNCIFWSDNPFVSDVKKRTNYTLYYTSQVPLCYSNIPDNTFKAFYLAASVVSDPNWGNPLYKESFAKATWATQAFSYYGARTIGLFGHDAPGLNITLPKDCRGLMYGAMAIENAGTFDASNTTKFGAKAGSWQEAFGECISLRNLYIKNLKTNLNLSWSPIGYESIYFIISEATNENAITISLSPYTYNLLRDSDFELAASKNITIELIASNYTEDKRWSEIANKADKEHIHSWNDLEDKPFYEISNELYNNTSFVLVTEDGWRFNAYDINFILEDGKQYKVVYGDNSYIYTAKVGTSGDVFIGNGSYGYRRNGEDNGEPVYIYNYPTDNPYKVMFYAKDYITSLAVYEYDFKPLDIKYLPEQLQIYESEPTEEVFFDQTVSNFGNYDETSVYWARDYENMRLELVVGETYNVTWDGITYTNLVCYDDEGLYTIGGSWHEGFGEYPFSIFTIIETTTTLTEAGALILVSNDTQTTHTVKIWNTKPNIKYLDSKYIKDMYYETEPQEVTLIDGIYEGFEDLDSSYGLIGDALFEPVVGQTYTVVWDGVTYADIVCIDDDGFLTIGDPYGDFSTIPFYMQYVSGLFGIFTNSTASSHSIKITTIQSEIIKIDKKYLPQLVGESTTGNVYTIWDNIQGREEEYIASAGAEIFNDYADNIATGEYSHAEGYETTATGENSHAEGGSTQAFGYSSHAEGRRTKAFGDYSHAEGYSTEATGDESHAEGSGATASGYSSHSEGNSTKATGDNSHAEGGYVNGKGTSYLSKMTVKPSEYSGIKENIDVYGPVAHGIQSHAEGTQTLAFGFSSHSEGIQTKAFGSYSHAEGEETIASGSCSHAEGYETKASGHDSHAEGSQTQANCNYSHAEGLQTVAYGDAIHVQGKYNFYEYTDNFSEYTESTDYVRSQVPTTPFLMGDSYTFNTITGTFTINNAVTTTTIAANKYIILDPAKNGKVTTIRKVTKTLSNSGTITYNYKAITRESKYAHIVGNGDGFTRSNAHILDWSGNAEFQGDVKANACGGENPISLVELYNTIQTLTERIAVLEAALNTDSLTETDANALVEEVFN